METVLLVIHLILAVSIVTVVLLQPSEGGMGSMAGGGNPFSGLTTAKGAKNLLTRLTAILITGFIITSLSLAILSGRSSVKKSILDYVPTPAAEDTVKKTDNDNNKASDSDEAKPTVPISQ